LLSNSLEFSFLTHSLQIHCIALFGPRSYYLLGLGEKLSPYKCKRRRGEVVGFESLGSGKGRLWNCSRSSFSFILSM